MQAQGRDPTVLLYDEPLEVALPELALPVVALVVFLHGRGGKWRDGPKMATEG